MSDMESVARAWDGLASSWAAMQGEAGDGNQQWIINPALFALAGEVRGKRVLDAACGGGHVARELARRGATVTAVDISARMVEIAARTSKGIDCRVAEKYGVRMCSGDTIGPGGIFRAMRELPEILRVAKDVERLCPDTWVINYINPTTVNGIGLMRHAPGVKSFAMCDSLHMPGEKRRWLVRAGVIREPKDATPAMERDFDLHIAGINHFPWLLKAAYKGKDMTPAIRRELEARAAKETARGHSKEVFNARYAIELWDVFGLLPTNLGHTKEYVRYWQGKNAAKGTLPPLKIFNAVERQKRHDAMWAEVDAYLSGKLSPEHFMQNHSQDHATDVIESMWGGLKKPFYVSSPNRGAVRNMDDDAFLELLCDIDMDGPRPRPVGAFPPGIRAMEQTVLETHELTVEAIVRCDRAVLRRAMVLDPLVPSIDDADAMIAELLKAEKAALPKCWFK